VRNSSLYGLELITLSGILDASCAVLLINIFSMRLNFHMNDNEKASSQKQFSGIKSGIEGPPGY